MSQDLVQIQDLRRRLKAPQRASLLEIMDETLEIMERIEKRVRYLEKSREETEG